jgi:hypothetical protein
MKIVAIFSKCGILIKKSEKNGFIFLLWKDETVLALFMSDDA